VFATLWIAFSDTVVRALKLPPVVNTIKGTLFVAVTASLLYFTIRRLVQAVRRAAQDRDEAAKQSAEALRHLNRELRAISNCNQILLRATDEQSLLKEICRIICEEAGYRVAWVGYAEEDEAKRVRLVAWTGVEEAYLAKLGITWADTELGRGPCGTAIRTGKTCCLGDYATDPCGAPWKEMALQHGLRSAIGLPLKDENGRVFGGLNIYSAQPNAFTSDEIRLLEELAGDLAFGIVTLRSRAARERAEQEVTLLSFALDKGRDAACLIDERARFCYVSEAACRILGYTRAALLGMGVADIDPDFPMERWSEHWGNLKAQRTLSFESRHRTREGRIFPVEISANYFEYGGRAYQLALVRDITERRRAEEERRESAERFRAIADYTYDWENWMGIDGKLLWVNPAVERITGYSVAECMAMPDFPVSIVAESDREALARQIREAVQGSSRNDFEFQVRHKDGRLVWVAASWQPIYDSRGARLGHRSSMRDIAERKRAEEELRKSEAYLAEGQRLSGTGSWAWSGDRAERHYWSEEMFRIFGFASKEGPPALERFLERIHPEDYGRATKHWEKTRRDQADLATDFRIVLPDGTIRDIYIIGHPVLDKSGNTIEYVGTAVDVTERKRAEEELREYREHLEDLVKQRTEELAVLNQLVYGSLEAADVGAWWIDFKEPDTCHALDNTAKMLGWEPDPTGKKTYKLSDWNKLLADTADAFPEHAPNMAATNERFAGAISGKYENYRAVYPLAMADGSLKWIDGRAEIAKRDEHGQALLMTGTLIDVTRSKRAEADLEEAKARAEAANRAKSTFLANMSHELRTPLNAVLGFSRLLKHDPDVTPQQQETLDVIVRSGEHLLNLINNVLDMAKIESGRVPLKESEADLIQLLHEMQSLMGAGAADKGLRFALEPDADLPRYVAVDAGKLRQVLLNLLGNAIKFTETGAVTLRARLASLQGAENARMRFEVEDSGPGLAAEDCERIFVPFVQLGGRAPGQAGTGLGLSICKEYVGLMGGRIGVTSKPGKGSTFYFEIPLRVLPAAAERDELKHGRILGLAQGQPRYRLLIVEDQPENRLLLRRTLNPLGFELREAANGQEAVALFEQWKPHLIWMDIRMPVMDGLEAVRRIRATPAGKASKIIALTAHALDEEREPIMAAGCDDLVRKPFQEQELFEAMARHLRLKFIYEKTPPPSAPATTGAQARPEQLDALPAQLRRELRQAVVELDTARTQTLIEQVAQHDAVLGQALNDLARQLDYKRLLNILEKESE
jgi:PAS domain S-box-containing protein